MNDKLKNKICIITGAASGMGASEAIAFAKQGATVIVADLDYEKAVEVTQQITQTGGNAYPFSIDVTNSDDLQKLVNFTTEKFGRIDILVNNAGIFDYYKNSLETSEELWDKIFNINIKSIFMLTNLVLPIMTQQQSGAVINIASIAGLVAQMGGASYTASKHAVIGYTKHLAAVYGKQGIKINAICPGTIKTPMTEKMLETRPTDKIPLDRFGNTDDISELAIFLASDDAKFMSGACIAIDGGYTIV